MNYYKLNHGIYPGTTHVYFNCTGEEVINHYNKRNKKNIIDENIKQNLIETKFGGYTIHKNEVCIIYVPKFQNKSNDYAILTHELLHCTFFILNYVNILYDIENHEAFTYFMDYLTGQLYKETFKEDFTKIK